MLKKIVVINKISFKKTLKFLLKIILYIFFSFSMMISTSTASEIINIGIIKGLWLSERSFFVKDEIEVNVIFHNSSEFKISGIVIFYDNKKEFYKEKIDVDKKDILHIKAPYTASSGEHTFSAKLIDTVKIVSGEKPKTVTASTSVVLGTESVFVDFDTDGDKMGDLIDEDDDNDGYSDIVEKESGSDPKYRISTPKSEDVLKTTKGVVEKITKNGSLVKNHIENLRKKLENVLLEKIEKEEIRSVQKKEKDSKKENNETKKKTKIEKVYQKKQIEISVDSIDEKDTEVKNYYLSFLKIIQYILSSFIFFIILILLSLWLFLKILIWFIWRKRNKSDLD